MNTNGETNMKIESLEIRNFRGIRSMDLALNSRMNVLVGVNGAGKSSVLDSIGILLSWVIARIRSAKSAGQQINELDITNGEHTSRVAAVARTADSSSLEWAIVKGRKGHPRPDEGSSLSQVSTFARSIQDQVLQSKQKCSIPVFASYPVNRAVLDIPLRIRQKHAFELLDTYDESLTGGANFRAFFEWFRNREDLENENRRFMDMPQGGTPSFLDDKQLNTVRQALERFLPDFSQFSIRRDPLRMEVKKRGQICRVDQLSDGEKCLIAFVGDLGRRLAIANPTMDNALEGEGIVLVDEIDLHLHPAWQRMVVTKLPDVFPNCQFILSTHSPQVISHMPPDQLFLLRQDAEGVRYTQPTESYGHEVSRILEDIMGVVARPQEVADKLHSLFSTIEAGRLAEARQQISQLRHDIGADPDLVKADVLIRRKEIIGK